MTKKNAMIGGGDTKKGKQESYGKGAHAASMVGDTTFVPTIGSGRYPLGSQKGLSRADAQLY